MIKRTSLVWKRPELSDAEFRRLWLGEHVTFAKALPGLREYVIDFVVEGPKGAPNGIATLRFDTREAIEDAFRIPQMQDNLLRTRDQFANDLQVMIVDEHIVVATARGEA